MTEAGGTDEDLPGLDPGPVGRWLADADLGEPPFSFELIAAGGSNLTYRVTDAEGRTSALRRPPEGRALATAHDVGREWRILTALAQAPEVPTPEPLARCVDIDVTGAPFYVMAFVDGTILRTRDDAAALDPTAGTTAAESLVAVQAALHALDVDEVGLGDLGRRTGYVDRQLRRWMSQVEKASARDLSPFLDVHRRLVASVPPEDPTPALLHGDYRFDNVVLGADHTVAAVLDWELCTLGDPAADACWSLQYWADEGDEVTFLPSPPTLSPSLPDRAWAMAEYERRSGRSLDDRTWFEAFGWWKMACILEGVHARRLAGSRGGMAGGDTAAIAASADRMLESAADRLIG